MSSYQWAISLQLDFQKLQDLLRKDSVYRSSLHGIYVFRTLRLAQLLSQVSEDVNGAARLENTRIYSAMLAKQSADAAAFRSDLTAVHWNPYQQLFRKKTETNSRLGLAYGVKLIRCEA